MGARRRIHLDLKTRRSSGAAGLHRWSPAEEKEKKPPLGHGREVTCSLFPTGRPRLRTEENQGVRAPSDRMIGAPDLPRAAAAWTRAPIIDDDGGSCLAVFERDGERESGAVTP